MGKHRPRYSCSSNSFSIALLSISSTSLCQGKHQSCNPIRYMALGLLYLLSLKFCSLCSFAVFFCCSLPSTANYSHQTYHKKKKLRKNHVHPLTRRRGVFLPSDFREHKHSLHECAKKTIFFDRQAVSCTPVIINHASAKKNNNRDKKVIDCVGTAEFLPLVLFVCV